MPTTQFTCPDCQGVGHRVVRGQHRPCPMRCVRDETAGVHQVCVDADAIRAALLSTRGSNKGRFHKSRPALVEDDGVYGAAYVWRMIRFHAGHDMTIPAMAPFYVGVWGLIDEISKPLLTALDELADTIGAELFGRPAMFRASARWGMALYSADTPIDPAARALPAPGNAAAVREGRPTRTGDEITFGDLARALGVDDCGDGLDIGDAQDSPEHFVETDLLDRDGREQWDDIEPEHLPTR